LVALGRWAPALTTGLVLALYMNVAQFARYVSDDYCSAGYLAERGWLATQATYYLDWTGRYATTALVTLVRIFGPAALPTALGLAVSSLMVAIAGAIRVTFRASVAAAAAGGIVAAFVLVAAAPQPFQTIYWLWGSANYMPPLVLGAAAVVIGARTLRDGRARWRWALAVVGFVTAGFSETSTATTLAVGLVLIALTLRPAWRAARPSIAAFLIGCLLGAAIVVAAPGNAGRFEQLRPPDLVSALVTTPGVAAAFAERFLFANVPVVAFVVLILAALAWGRLVPALPRTWFLAGSIAVIGLLPATIFPAVWATSAVPPDRALLYPAAAVLGWFAALGWVIGSAAARSGVTLPRAALGAAMILLAIVPLMTFGELHAARSELARWAQRQDQLVAILAEGRGGTVVAEWQYDEPGGFLSVGLRQPGSDPAFWINECVARLYGIEAVILTR
jgi:hypothetical protein